MTNYTAPSDRCPALSVSSTRSDPVFASLSFILIVRNTDPSSDTLVLSLLHKFPPQKVQINLSLTGSLIHSVPAVNGWQSADAAAWRAGGAIAPPSTFHAPDWLLRIWTFVSLYEPTGLLGQLSCVFLLPALILTPLLAPLCCARCHAAAS